MASIFADPHDIHSYMRARASGATEAQALSVGDNGRGKWGDVTATYKIPMVALPKDTPGLSPGRLVKVTGPQGTAIGKVADEMPATAQLKGAGAIDLNPAMAAAVGHTGGVVPVSWEWASDPGDTPQVPVVSDPAGNLMRTMSARQQLGYSTGSQYAFDPTVPKDAKITSRNPDGSVTWSDGITIYRDGTMYRDIGDERFIRHPNGQYEKAGKTPKDKGNEVDDATYKALEDAGLDPVKGETKEDARIRIAQARKQEPEAGHVYESLGPTQKLIADQMSKYDLPFSTMGRLLASKDPTGRNIIAGAIEKNPDLDATNYQAKQRVKNSFTSGKDKANIQSLRQVIYHLERLKASAEALNNHDWTSWNSFGNYVLSKTGDPRIVRFDNDANAVANEMATVFKNSGATDVEGIKSWHNQLNSSESPAQLHASINEAAELAASRLGVIQKAWTDGMGTSTPFPILDKKSAHILTKLGAGDSIGDAGLGAEEPAPATQPAAAPKPTPADAIAEAQRRLQLDPTDKKAQAVIQRAKDLGLTQ
jgi:hypothetical protein